MVRDERLHVRHAPQVVLVAQPVRRFAGGRVALIRKLVAAVDRVVAAALQLGADRGLSGPRDALDQVVLDPHLLDARSRTACFPFRKAATRAPI